MTERTFLTGYQGKWLSLAELNKLAWWRKVHPEIRRRIVAWMIDAQNRGHAGFGPGNAFRTTAQQQQTHDKQPTKSPTPGGSYHEACRVAAMVVDGEHVPEGDYGLAVDMIWNADLDAEYVNAAKYGLVCLHDYKNDRPHMQPAECSRSRARGRKAPYVLSTWKLPNAPSAPAQPPKPTTPPPGGWDRRLGAWGPLWAAKKPRTVLGPAKPTGDHVRYLQGVLTELSKRTTIAGAATLNPGGVDGIGGPKTAAAVRRYQAMRSLEVDGIAGPQTWASIDRDALALVTGGR